MDLKELLTRQSTTAAQQIVTPPGHGAFDRGLMKSNARLLMQRHYRSALVALIAVIVVSVVVLNILGNILTPLFEYPDEALAAPVALLLASLVTRPLHRSLYIFFINLRTNGTSKFHILDGFKRSCLQGLVRMLAADIVISVVPMLTMLVPLILFAVAEEAFYDGLATFMALATVVGAVVYPIMAVVRRYKYFPVYYMIAEDPDIPIKKLFESGKAATKGVRAQIFILELSFVGWYLLGLLTCFIGALFIAPYHRLTMTETYCFLKARYSVMYGKELCAASPTVEATTAQSSGFPKATAPTAGFPKPVTPTSVTAKATTPSVSPKGSTSSAGTPKATTPTAPISPTTPTAAAPVIMPTAAAAPKANNDIPKPAVAETVTKTPPSAVRDELVVVEYPVHSDADRGDAPRLRNIDNGQSTDSAADATDTVRTLTQPLTFARPTLTKPELTNAADIDFPCGDKSQQ